MVKLNGLKIGKLYYIVDKDGCYDDVIIKFEVLGRVINSNKEEKIEARFLKYMYDDEEVEVIYCNNEDVIEEFCEQDENRIFELNDYNKAEEYLEEVKEESMFEISLFSMEDYDSPEDYPDWDGDESMMYYIEHCNE